MGAVPFPKVIYSYSSRRLLSYFSAKKFSLSPVLPIDAMAVLFWFILELGILLHLTLPLIPITVFLNED